MSAWLIVDTKITDANAYEAYKVGDAPLVAKYGGVYRARGGAMDIRETDLWAPTRMVLIEFPSMEDAHGFLDDPAYAEVKPIRHANADSTVLVLEGL